MSFVRSHHQVIASAIGCLDAGVLRARQCYFAGGTALALRFGEYRESVDIDFVVADNQAYQGLREECRRDGFAALALAGQRVVLADDLRIDQYGIRTRLNVAGVPVKFEIIREARIEFERPRPADVILGVATPQLVDLMAMKLLANSDRWTDPTVFSRDIIDLAMARPRRPVLAKAIAKATGAYGQGVQRDARSAVTSLMQDGARLERCRQALAITQSRAVLVDRLHRLAVSLDAADSI